jgi:hypothetical protein
MESSIGTENSWWLQWPCSFFLSLLESSLVCRKHGILQSSYRVHFSLWAGFLYYNLSTTDREAFTSVADPRGAGGAPGERPALKLEKIWFFSVKSWFFTRNTPTIFLSAPPITWNPGSAPVPIRHPRTHRAAALWVWALWTSFWIVNMTFH